MLKPLLDIIYPTSCAVCGATAETHVCANCRAAVTIHPTLACCSICGKMMMNPESAGNVVAVCGQCHSQAPKFDAARSAGAFSGPLRTLVHKFKYNKATWLRRELGELLEGCVIANFSSESIDIICPVPLSPVKQRSRGYNQAAILAKDLARNLSIPNVPKILRRARNTPTQTHLDAAQRRKNVAGAFLSPPNMRPLVYGRCILLVDDVMTTGATLSECAATLKANGAERVLAVTLARD